MVEHRLFDINFITFSPTAEYVDYIGGVMVNHSLAHYLAELGENSYIYANSTKNGYKSTLIPWGTEVEFDPQNTILITPAGAGEHTFENHIPPCLNSIPNRVRWLVNDQKKLYPTSDKFYKHIEYFPVLGDQRIDGKFFVLDVDYDIFYDRQLKRSGGCYFTKGQSITTKYHDNNDLNLDNIYSIPSIQRNKYLSDIFNTKEYFICYSHRSFIAGLAALCGCNVIVIPYDGASKEYWMKGMPVMKYGVAYGVEDIQWAIDTKHLVTDHVKDFQKKGIDSVQTFINDCYNWIQIKYNI
jgi:hypothetical protein